MIVEELQARACVRLYALDLPWNYDSPLPPEDARTFLATHEWID